MPSKKLIRYIFWPVLTLFSFLNAIKNFILKIIFIILGPYSVIKKETFTFMLWVAVVVVIGQFGIILSLLINYNIGFEKNIYNNLYNGNFYIFSISLLGISIYDGFVQYLNSNETTLFKKYQIGSWVIAFILVIFMSALYAITAYKDAQFSYSFTQIDAYMEIIFYVLSIALSVYIFAVKHLDTHKDDFYHLADDKDVKNLQFSADNIDDTIEGGIEI